MPNKPTISGADRIYRAPLQVHNNGNVPFDFFRFTSSEMVQMLLSAGADPNIAGAEWATPMAWATKKGHDEIVKLLRKHRATS